ncbi:DUF2511 domain-containing protein [Streptomyces alkaliphilus]|uniref:DUF2511 domain-containing protein n=2 Tax=Streptomyces alkaliphilus TaxID=1472722 RepID=A0A7W3Y3V3_9ACTN|nr:DUF2511 domain-containing protein [Streptomyces alkaliphilus]
MSRSSVISTPASRARGIGPPHTWASDVALFILITTWRQSSHEEDGPGTISAMRTTTTAALTLLLALTTAACTEEPEEEPLRVSSSDFPDGQWPFTVDAGNLSCEEASVGRAILFEADGTTYVLNGPATILAEERGWARMHPIWADDPGDSRNKIPTTALEDFAKENC